MVDCINYHFTTASHKCKHHLAYELASALQKLTDTHKADHHSAAACLENFHPHAARLPHAHASAPLPIQACQRQIRQHMKHHVEGQQHAHHLHATQFPDQS